MKRQKHTGELCEKGEDVLVVGIIDVGANSIRLSIYAVDGKDMKLLLNKKETAGLSAYVKEGALSLQGMKKACIVLESFKDILKNVDVPDYYAFATASLRNISNTQEAVDFISVWTGIKLEVLTGEEEARLGFEGAVRLSEFTDGLLIDIGGGSTEIIKFNDKKIAAASSLPMGSLNLYVKYVKKLFPSEKAFKKMKAEILSELTAAIEFVNFSVDTIIGIGGTVRTVTKLNNEFFELPPENTEIETKNLEKLLDYYEDPDGKALRTILRIAPERIHTIIPGMIILNTMAQHYGARKILASNNSIREGFMYNRIIGEI